MASVLMGLRLFVSCLVRGRVKHVYIGVAGGHGKAYDLVFTLLSRAAQARLFLSHNSYSYLNRRSNLARLLFWLAGKQTTHIVLCDSMASRLRENYQSVANVVIVSNVVSIKFPNAPPTHRQRLTTVGLISNLTRAKGVLEFFAVNDRCHREGVDLRGLLAGPVHEPGIDSEIREQVRHMPWIKYLGPVRGDAKDHFYRDIDVLLLATRHVDEAEPLVVLEALAHGVVVIAFARGCIPSLLKGVGDAAIPTTADFVEEATTYLRRWWHAPEEFRDLSNASTRRASQMLQESSPMMDATVAAMVGAQAST